MAGHWLLSKVLQKFKYYCKLSLLYIYICGQVGEVKKGGQKDWLLRYKVRVISNQPFDWLDQRQHIHEATVFTSLNKKASCMMIRQELIVKTSCVMIRQELIVKTSCGTII